MEESPAIRLIVCIHERMGDKASCGKRGSSELSTLLEQALNERGLAIPLVKIKCLGNCNEGPNIRIAPGGAYFSHCTAETLPTILEALEAAIKLDATPPDSEKGDPGLIYPQF